MRRQRCWYQHDGHYKNTYATQESAILCLCVVGHNITLSVESDTEMRVHMKKSGMLYGKRWLMAGIAFVMIWAATGCEKETASQTNITDNAGVSEAVQITEAPAVDMPQSQEIALGQTMDLCPVSLGQEQGSDVTSADSSIVRVLEDGSIFGIKQGETTVNTTIGEKTYQTKVTVDKSGMVYPVFEMLQGEKLSLQFSSKDDPSSYTWVSTNEEVAKVSAKGTIKAKGVGTAVIMGSSSAEKYRCEITVSEKPDKIVYLTFDDGPNRYSTPKILDILEENDVKATFFELKPAKKDFDLTERILAEGHTLAIHGYKHKYEEIYVSEDVYHENLDKLRDLFFQKFGVWCTLTRFPGGSSNMVSSYNPGIMTKITKKIDGWGYHYFDWNVSSGDAGGASNAEDVLRNCKRQISEGHVKVVLMHDFYKNDKTIDALDKVIKYGKKHGYTFLPLTASTEEVHHKVNN